MAAIIDRVSGSRMLAPAVAREQWTVVIAAAGRGTRLGFDRPKILFPVGGVTILERLVRLFSPLCAKLVFVLSPDGAPEVEPDLQALLSGRAQIAIQQRPVGMADAVYCGASVVSTVNTAVVWGDQFALKPSSLEFCMRLLQGNVYASSVLPTLLCRDPYIHFDRDPHSDRILSVLQRREGDMLPAEGESDSGVFFFRTEALMRCLPGLLSSPAGIGRVTGEQNFLPVFPLLDEKPGRLITPRIMTATESRGVNTRDDARFIEAEEVL